MLFKEVKDVIHFKKKHSTIESAVFQSMKVAMVCTLAATVLVTTNEFIGDNINCVTGFSDNEHKAIETYCFISSTYTLINFTEGVAPYPGVGPGNDDDELVRHAYYQWVGIVLAMQTMALYSCKWFWKNFVDRSYFVNLLNKLNDFKIYDHDRKKDINKSARYMAESILRDHDTRIYAIKFLLCEIAAFGIALGNLFFTNAFLGGSFFQYGSTALSYISNDVTDMNNPMNIVFPKVAKCIWHKFGPSGSIQTFDSLCVLPLNIVNEKTYIFLWLVYIITFSVVCIVLFYHIMLFLLAALRDRVILRQLKTKGKYAYSKFLKKNDFMTYGRWFVMHHLCHHMAGDYFEKWIIAIPGEMLTLLDEKPTELRHMDHSDIENLKKQIQGWIQDFEKEFLCTMEPI